MKKIFFLLLIASLLTAGIAFNACKSSSKFTAGEIVAAKWTNGSYYLAKITAVKGTSYDVNYLDGSKGTVAEADIMKIPLNISLKTGDKVLAAWTDTKFYTGTVEEVKSNSAMVKWDDGSPALEVPFGQIIKQ